MKPALVLLAALAVDALMGEWPNALHPVVWMGQLQTLLRKGAPRSAPAAYLYGTFMALIGPAIFGGGSWWLLRGLQRWPAPEFIVSVFLFKSTFAIRALAQAGRAASNALRTEDDLATKQALRSLVSRDTSALSRPLMAAAAVESVAENTSDSVIAPLLFYLAGGIPAALGYRAANTLDAMIGYHGETEWLGKTAARLDDLLNLIPARLTALLFTLCAPLCGLSGRNAFRIWWRDSGLTESPNAGRPMAAMAGALGVQLEKVGHYKLGDALAVPDASSIDRAISLMLTASILFAAAIALVMAHASATAS